MSHIQFSHYRFLCPKILFFGFFESDDKYSLLLLISVLFSDFIGSIIKGELYEDD